MNAVHMIGNIVKDPELKTNKNGKSVCRFSIAISRPRKNGEDQGADFPSCVAWGSTAELIAKYAVKGKKVAINGSIHTGHYPDKDGKTVYTTEVWVDTYGGVEFLSPKGNSTSASFLS